MASGSDHPPPPVTGLSSGSVSGSVFSDVACVFLDAEGTLFTFAHSVGEVYSRTLDGFGPRIPAGKIDAVLPKVWAEFRDRYLGGENGYETSEAREREVWLEFASRLVVAAAPDLVPTGEMIEAIYLAFTEADTRTVKADAIRFLEAIRARGMRTGILSNNDGRLVPLVSNLGIADLFDYLCPASHVGFKKPSAQCFERVADLAGFRADEVLYVGNDLELDCIAARNAGWRAVLYHPSGEDLPPREFPPAEIPVVRTFGELLALVAVG